MPNSAGKLPVSGRWSILKGCLQVPGEQPLGLLTDHAARVTLGELVHHRGGQPWGNPLFSFHTRVLSWGGCGGTSSRELPLYPPNSGQFCGHMGILQPSCASHCSGFALVLTCCVWFKDEDAEVMRMHNLWFRDEESQLMA